MPSLLVSCLCGVRIKVPPAFKGTQVKCTRCGRDHQVPVAKKETAAGGDPGATAPDPTAAPEPGAPMSYQRKGDAWESFRCSCDRVQQLSPAFHGKRLRCKGCGQSIQIHPA